MKKLFQFDSYLIDVAERTLFRDGEPVPLTPKTFDTLLLLVEGKGGLLDREKLISALWDDLTVEENNLTQQISALRKVLGLAPDGKSYIETMPKRGYRFHASVKEFYDQDDALVVEKYTRSHITIEQTLPATTEAFFSPVPLVDPQVARTTVAATSSLAALRRWQTRRILLTVGSIATVLIVGVIIGVRFLRPVASAPQTEDWRRQLKPTLVQTVKQTGNDAVEGGQFSPDGLFIAYCLYKGSSKQEIWLTTSNGETPRQVTEDDYFNFSPIWIPGRGEIAYLSIRNGNVGLWKISMLGGHPTLVHSLEEFHEAGNPVIPLLQKWSVNKERVYLTWKKNFYWLDLQTGGLTRVTDFDPIRSDARGFDVSADEMWFSYVITVEKQQDIWRMPTGGGEAVRVTDDADREVKCSWHPDGNRILYKSASPEGVNQICSVDVETGQVTQIHFDNDNGQVADVSPDGTKFLYVGWTDQADLWKVDVNTARGEQLTSDVGVEFWPCLSPDSAQIAYQVIKGSHTNFNSYKNALYIRAAAATGQPRQIASQSSLPRWSPDGTSLAFFHTNEEGQNLWSLDPVTGEQRKITTREVTPGEYLLFPFNRVDAMDYSWSPDSTKIVYRSGRKPFQNLYIVSRDGSSETQVTDNTDPARSYRSPCWSPDGAKLAYISDDRNKPAGASAEWLLSVYDGASSLTYLTTAESTRLLGWLNDEEVVIATAAHYRNNHYSPMAVTLRAVSAAGSRELTTLAETLLVTVQLASDGRSVAFVSTRDGAPNIYTLSLAGTAAKKITDNREPSVFFSYLVWSRDGKFIVYGRQSREYQLTLMNNFK